MRPLIATGILFGSCLVGSSAIAANGWVSGTLNFYNDVGNFCDTGLSMTCTGAHFLRAHVKSQQPVKNAIIHLVDQDVVVIGIGTTDSSGNFTVAWSRATEPSQIQVRRFYTYKDQRFWLAFTSGAIIYDTMTPAPSPPFNGINRSIGTVNWPFNIYANTYEGARRSWENALLSSADMQSRFTLVRIVMHTPATGAPDNRVEMADVDLKRPQSALQHEIGHVVEYLQKTRAYCGAFNYPTRCLDPKNPRTQCLGDGHLFNTPEWMCMSYAEGLAQFISNAAFYAFNATKPIQCIKDIACGNSLSGNTLNFETSKLTNCSVSERRKPVNVTRYLWDTFDTVVDSNPSYPDNVPSSDPGFKFGKIVDNLDLFPAGIEDHQADEPWKTLSFLTLDTEDGKSAADVKPHIDAIEDATTQYTNNCDPG